MSLRLLGCIAALAAVLIGGCKNSVPGETGGGGGVPPPPPSAGQPVRFLAMGDAGSIVFNSVTNPTEGQGQAEAVAALAEKVCALRGCDFAMMAGDNIYETGVISEADPLFQMVFELPYLNFDMPFFMALGNHDNSNSLTGEGSNNAKGDFEVDYHYSELNSGKWFMPDRYYSVRWPADAPEPVVELFVMDSSPISHFFDDPSPLWSGATLETYVADQMTFLQDGLAASPARWKFAMAHHPYISNGEHGNAGEYDFDASPDPCTVTGPFASDSCRGADYKSFVENTICNKADVYFSGHDHNLYWMNPVSSCGKTHHILSGAASKARDNHAPERNPAFYQSPDMQFGFFWIELNGDVFTGAAYTMNADGEPGTTDADGNPAPDFVMSFTRTP